MSRFNTADSKTKRTVGILTAEALTPLTARAHRFHPRTRQAVLVRRLQLHLELVLRETNRPQ